MSDTEPEVTPDQQPPDQPPADQLASDGDDVVEGLPDDETQSESPSA